MSDFEKFKEEFSRKEKFSNLLAGKKISDKEHEHVLNVWNKFEMKTMNGYHNLYLKCDILLLADVFENFRSNSAPALSWNAMSKIKKVVFELFPNPDTWIFFKKGTRCRVFYFSNRYSKASSNYLTYYDRRQESKLIIYLDIDNLSGYAMYKFLSKGGFKWIDPKEFDLNKYTSNSSKGCVLVADLEYPIELCEIALEKIKIKREMLSRYQLMIADFRNIPFGNVKKLTPNFFEKEKYVIHYENLQLYLYWRLGLKLKK